MTTPVLRELSPEELRDEQIIQDVVKGSDLGQVAHAYNVTLEHIHGLFQPPRFTSSTSTAKAVELQRLDVATKALMPRVEAGELDAMDRLLKVQARRAKYLGLDAPKVEEKREVIVKLDWMGEARVKQLQSDMGNIIENQPAPAALPAPADVVDVEARPVGDQQAALDARMAAHEQERYPERSAFPRRPKPKEELTPEQKQAEANRIRAGEAPRM